VDVLFSAGFEGWCAKRSGFGVLVDLIVRMVVCEGLGGGRRGRRALVDEGRRKGGGRSPQLRGALGGIVLVVDRVMT
jgi:hypothetical protein